MKNNIRILLAAVLAMVVSTVAAETITVNGTSRSYNVYAPKDLGENRPLLIFCHGYNQDANWMQNSEFKNETVSMEAVCDTAKFVVVFPNGIDRAWDIGGDRDINFIKAIIEKMAAQYKIDRNRIYMGGFSMGGMLTYNAINKMSDIIAAFVSCSGPSVVTPNAKTRAVPILHIQGTADNFGGVQPALNPWIQHNGCPTTEKVINNYNGFSGAKLHIWGPGNNGVEVRLIELKDKGHWICKEPQVYTGKEIWNFCKRYSLELKDPSVRFTTPQSGLQYITIGGASETGDLTLNATASDPDGKVATVAFYDGSQLLATFDKAPYTYVLQGLTKGEHTLRAVVTDDEGRTGSSEVVVSVQESTHCLLHKAFTAEGSVPAGWATYDGNERRVGVASGFSSGSRVFHFTGAQHDFDWGLYTRNATGGKKTGYARFADKATATSLTLYPGNYRLMCRVSNWNQASFSPVTFAVETMSGQQVWTKTFTPTSNVGNAASNDFSGTTLETFYFDVTEKGRYALTFYTADAPWADLVVGQAAIYRVGNVTGISQVTADTKGTAVYYNLNGQRLQQAQPSRKGLYIHQGRKVVVN
jgi:poly(3-hydroxybutyrate) depolymerase